MKKKEAKAKPAKKPAAAKKTKAPKQAPDTLSPDDELGAARAGVAEDPKDSNAHYNLGRALMMSIEPALTSGQMTPVATKVANEAETCMLKALELFEGHGRAHIMVGQLYRYTGRVEQALPHLESALGLPPKSDDWLRAADGLASCHMMLGSGAKAIEVLKQAIKNHPKVGYLHYKLGACHYDAGNMKDAAKALETAVALDPSNQPAREMLDTAKAAAQYQAQPQPTYSGNVDYAAAQAKSMKLTEEFQVKVQKIMAGSESAEKKQEKVLKLQAEFQKDVQKLYGAQT